MSTPKSTRPPRIANMNSLPPNEHFNQTLPTMASTPSNANLVQKGYNYVNLIRTPKEVHTPANTRQILDIEAKLGRHMTNWLRQGVRKSRREFAAIRKAEIEERGYPERDYDPCGQLTGDQVKWEAKRAEEAAGEMCEGDVGYDEVLLGAWKGLGEERDGGQIGEEVRGILEALERIPEFVVEVGDVGEGEIGRTGGKGREEYGGRSEASWVCGEDEVLALFDEFPDFEYQVPVTQVVEKEPEKQLPQIGVEKVIEMQSSLIAHEKAKEKKLPETIAEKVLDKQISRATLTKALESQHPGASNVKEIEAQHPTPISEKVIGKQVSKSIVEETNDNGLPETSSTKEVRRQLLRGIVEETGYKPLPKTIAAKPGEMQLPIAIVNATSDKQLPNAIVVKTGDKQLHTAIIDQSTNTQLRELKTKKVAEIELPKSTPEKKNEKQVPTSAAEKTVEKRSLKATAKKTVEKTPTKAIRGKPVGKQSSGAGTEETFEVQPPKNIAKNVAEKQPPKAKPSKATGKQPVKHSAPIAGIPEVFEDAGPSKRRKTSASTSVPVTKTSTQPWKILLRPDIPSKQPLVPYSSSPEDEPSPLAKATALKTPDVETPVAEAFVIQSPVAQLPEAKKVAAAKNFNVQQSQSHLLQDPSHDSSEPNITVKGPKTAASDLTGPVKTSTQSRKITSEPEGIVKPSESPRLIINFKNKGAATGFEAIRDPLIASSSPTKQVSKSLKSSYRATSIPSVSPGVAWSWGDSHRLNRAATTLTTAYTLPRPPPLPEGPPPPLFEPATFVVQPSNSFHQYQSGNTNSFGHPSRSPQNYGSHVPNAPYGSQQPSSFLSGAFSARSTGFTGPERPNNTFNPSQKRPRNQQASHSFTSPSTPNMLPTTPPVNYRSRSQGSTNQPSERSRLNSEYNISPTPSRTPRGSLHRHSNHTDCSSRNRNAEIPDVNNTPIPFIPNRPTSRSTSSRPRSPSRASSSRPTSSRDTFTRPPSTRSRVSSSREVATITFETTRERDTSRAMLGNKIATDAALGELIVEPVSDELTMTVSGPPTQNLRGKLRPLFGGRQVDISMKT